MRTKTNLLRLIAFAVCLCTVFCFAACGEDEGTGGAEGNTLVVNYYDGGYGQEWAEDLVKRYEATHEGVKITMRANANILTSIAAKLKEKNPDVDVFISHDITWQQFAKSGYLADLDELYSSTLSDGTKFEDAVLGVAKDYSKVKGLGDSSEHYYKVCWTQGAGGLVYNVDIKLMEKSSMSAFWMRLKPLKFSAVCSNAA